jgi:hypothetical protein
MMMILYYYSFGPTSLERNGTDDGLIRINFCRLQLPIYILNLCSLIFLVPVAKNRVISSFDDDDGKK